MECVNLCIDQDQRSFSNTLACRGGHRVAFHFKPERRALGFVLGQLVAVRKAWREGFHGFSPGTGSYPTDYWVAVHEVGLRCGANIAFRLKPGLAESGRLGCRFDFVSQSRAERPYRHTKKLGKNCSYPRIERVHSVQVVGYGSLSNPQFIGDIHLIYSGSLGPNLIDALQVLAFCVLLRGEGAFFGHRLILN